MISKTLISISMFLLLTMEAIQSFEVVVDLPLKLTFSKNHSLVVTTFGANQNETFTVEITTRCENANCGWDPIMLQSIFSSPSDVDIRRFNLMINTKPRGPNADPASDVMFHVIVNVSVASASGNGWMQEKRIPVVKLKGHIFIQVDRPLFSPGDQVFVRFIPVDEALIPLNQPMEMTIMAPNPNPRGSPLVSWTKRKAATNQVLVRSFRLPEMPPIGQWIVTARFFRDDEIVPSEHFTAFYVQDSAIPSFDLTIQPITDSFVVSDNQNLRYEVVARFMYGELVDGSASIRIGLVNQLWENNPVIIKQVLSNQRVQRGRLNFPVRISNLTKDYNFSFLAESQTSVFVEVTVVDVGGVHTRSKRHTDVKFTSSPINIKLDRSSDYYKPGLRYIIRGDVSYPNGSAAVETALTIVVWGNHSNRDARLIFNAEVHTIEKGKLVAYFRTPTDRSNIEIRVRAQYNFRGTNFLTEETKVVHPQSSNYDQYMQVVPPLGNFSVGGIALLNVYFTPSTSSKTIVFTLSSVRGYNTDGKVNAGSNAGQVTLSIPVVSEMSPLSHISVYYVTRTRSGLPFIVTDSTSILIEETCQGRNLEVNFLENEPPYPGDRIDFTVRGEPFSYVGLTGADKTAFSLGKDYEREIKSNTATVSRKNMFDVLKSQAPGCKESASAYPESAFPAIGRIFLSSVSHNVIAATDDQCSQRNRRSITAIRNRVSILKHSGDQFLSYECCAVGASNVDSVVTYGGDVCQRRAETVELNDQCKKSFLICCREAQKKARYFTQLRIRNFSPRQTSTITVNADVPQPSTFQFSMEKAVQLNRRNFAWTWFNSDFTFGNSGYKRLNNESNPKLSRLPDGITSWFINGFSLSQKRGLCVINPITFEVQHSLFLEVGLPIQVVRGTPFTIEVTLYSYVGYVVTASVSFQSEDNICIAKKRKKKDLFIPSSTGGIARIEKVRFIVIPLKLGTKNIVIRMNATYNNLPRQRVDKVTKKVVVVAEGVRKRRVEWILVDSRGSNRRRSPTSTLMVQLSLPIPPNAIPGSEEARVKMHSFSSAFIQKPLANSEESSTIRHHLIQLQYIISKLEILKSVITEFEKDDLSDEAQSAYTGLLRYVREVRNISVAGSAASLYGFSFSPAETSKPDLWLSCAVLQTICTISELVEINPDQDVLTGSLRWIMLHQNRGKNAYFADKPILNKGRTKKIRGARLKFKPKFQSRNYRQQRRNSTEITRTESTNRIDRKLYRTAVISTCLSSINRSTNQNTKESSRRDPNAFNAVNTDDLRNSLRRSLQYIRVNILKHHATLSPITIAATARAVFTLSGRSNSILEETLHNLKQENEDDSLWWIENVENSDIDEPEEMRRRKSESISIETTAYALHLMTLRGRDGGNYANWLQKQRDSNNQWRTLLSSFAAMEALRSYVQYFKATSRNQNTLRIDHTSEMPAFARFNFGVNPETQKTSMKISTRKKNMNLTMSGFGKSWVELDVSYNMPETEQEILTSSGNLEESIPLMCPFNVTVSLKPAAVMSVGALLRSSTSGRVLQIDLQIRYKLWYHPLEHSDTSYVVDFGLHSNYEPLTSDLEKLCNPVEKVIDYYLISQKGLFLYFHNERNISFRIIQMPMNVVLPIPYSVYPAAFPERRCYGYYTPPGAYHKVSTLCSNNVGSRRTGNDICICVTSAACPKVIGRGRSVRITTETRVELTCKPSTEFAYRVRLQNKESGGRDWWIYTGLIRHVYKSPNDTQNERNVNASFWVKKTCNSMRRVSTSKDYFLIGKSVVEAENGLFKHLLDSLARFEQWPGRVNNCDRFSGKTLDLCQNLDYYHYTMLREGCQS